MEISGKKIILALIKPEEKGEFFELVTKSYGGKFWYDGEARKKLTKEKLLQEWPEGYFDLSAPERGQCFWIILNGKKIGAIDYNEIDTINKNVELDILISSEQDLGKGYGTDALRALTKYLFENFDINKIRIKVRINNPRAIRACEKAGFKRESSFQEENYFEGKFVDCVGLRILKREFKQITGQT